jgi:predicted permease
MFTVLTLLTLAIGIGANTAVFSVVNAILLKPLPFHDPDRLIAIWAKPQKQTLKEWPMSPAAYFTFRDEGKVFQDVTLWSVGWDNMTGNGEPELVDALYVDDGFLPLLGVRPTLGRPFSRQDDSPGPATVILMNDYWRRKFGADPSVIGRRIMVDGESAEIIGVMPPGFWFMDKHAAVIAPYQWDRAKVFIGQFGFHALARLKPGETLASASVDVGRMFPIMVDRFPPQPGMTKQMAQSLALQPIVRPLKSDLVGDIGKLLWVLMGAIGAVLLIACANVTNLLLVRSEGRRQELAIRAALGAGWWPIAKELLLESVVLGVSGGLLGVGVAYGALRLLAVIDPGNLPRLDQIRIDPTVLLFSLSISLVAGVLSASIPVFKYRGAHLAGVLREGGRNASEGRERHRARNLLVIVQVALAMVLLIGSGLLLRTASALRQVPTGFTRPRQILTMQISVPDAETPKQELALQSFYGILEKVNAIPGVEFACISTGMTMDGSRMMGYGSPIFAADQTYSDGGIPPVRRFKYISPAYFKTMGNTLVAGRDLTLTDIFEARPVAIVSEALARELWRQPAAALGKRIQEVPNAPWREIVGVAGNEHDEGPDHAASAIVYLPTMVRNLFHHEVVLGRDQFFAVRSRQANSAKLLNDVRQAVWSVNRNLPLAKVRTMQEIYDQAVARPSFALVMLTIAAGMALLLGVVGIYGVISYAVSQRTREIGIRMALGAPQQSVRLLFVRECLLLIVVGLVCGVAVAAALSSLMTSLLFDVSPLDAATYLTVSAVLAAAALLASYIPARRATTIEPMEALRAE